MASSENKKARITAAGGMAAITAAAAQVAHAQHTGKIRIGLLGCGGRGNGALRQCLEADPGVEVIALADLFESQVRKTRDGIARDGKFKDRVKIDDDHMFWGFDCHEKIARCEADLLLMATAPAFRTCCANCSPTRQRTISLISIRRSRSTETSAAAPR